MANSSDAPENIGLVLTTMRPPTQPSVEVDDGCAGLSTILQSHSASASSATCEMVRSEFSALRDWLQNRLAKQTTDLLALMHDPAILEKTGTKVSIDTTTTDPILQPNRKTAFDYLREDAGRTSRRSDSGSLFAKKSSNPDMTAPQDMEQKSGPLAKTIPPHQDSMTVREVGLGEMSGSLAKIPSNGDMQQQVLRPAFDLTSASQSPPYLQQQSRNTDSLTTATPSSRKTAVSGIHGQVEAVNSETLKGKKSLKVQVNRFLVKTQLTSHDAPEARSVRKSEMEQDWNAKMAQKFRIIGSTRSSVMDTVSIQDYLSYRIVHGPAFNMLVAIVIVANAVVIGFDVENAMWNALHSRSQHVEVFIYFNLAFTAFFAMELLARLGTERVLFLFGSDWYWNVFDTFLVIMSCADIFSAGDPTTSTPDGNRSGIMRLVKNIRMVRVLRIIRLLRFFRELRRMCMSIISSMAALTWALMFLAVIVYVFAVIFMQAGVEDMNADAAADVRDMWEKWYGSMANSIFTLTQAISGGDNWAVMTEPLQSASVGYVIAFVFYVLFVVLGVLNVLTGVFLGSAAEVLVRDRDWVTQAEGVKTETFVKNFHALFAELDLDRSGTLHWDEFCIALQRPETQAFFSANGLDLTDAHLVFSLVAGEDNMQIDIDEFVQGCSKLKGAAKSVQIMALLKETETLSAEIGRMSSILSQVHLLLRYRHTKPAAPAHHL